MISRSEKEPKCHLVSSILRSTLLSKKKIDELVNLMETPGQLTGENGPDTKDKGRKLPKKCCGVLRKVTVERDELLELTWKIVKEKLTKRQIVNASPHPRKTWCPRPTGVGLIIDKRKRDKSIGYLQQEEFGEVVNKQTKQPLQKGRNCINNS